MKAIRLRIISLTCSCLLTAPFLSFAQTNNKATAAFPNNAAIASYSNSAALWLHDPAFSPGQAPGKFSGAGETHSSDVPALCPHDPAFSLGQVKGNAQELAKPPSSDVRALLLQDMAFSLDQAEASAQQQTKPSSGNEPSLQGLGFPPNEIHGSAKEQALLNKRSHMLQIHQKLGLLTTIPLLAALFSGPGAKGHHGLPGSPTGRDVHMGLGILTTGMYAATAYYAIRAPKIPGTKTHGLIRLHKALAWIHGPGMILTPILGEIAYSQLSRGERVHGIAKYHSVVAYTTAVAYGAAILSVTIK